MPGPPPHPHAPGGGVEIFINISVDTSSDNTYEKSFIWIVDKKNIEDFSAKINRENCKINGENS